ncbi:MAG: large subunit ribosomal protein, partial [Methanolobus sp.]|nr:large subunit ribosomal protein [Methanolobus sp.]
DIDKVLGSGKVSKKLAITAAEFSASAKEKIEGAGGSCTEIEE